MAAFGDDCVLLERYIQLPRHIEVQIIADSHGNVYYISERDCSVQRRHQKVVEEAPAPGIKLAFRASIGQSAVDAARAVGYRNAGTVEFIVDSSTGEYFFMEMNTRLQVEHPVTEAVTGLDLVELQLRVAAGQRLDALLPPQERFNEPKGHAVEARLYAENPKKGFLPSGGRILRWKPPPQSLYFTFNHYAQEQEQLPSAGGVQVRVDSGVRAGDSVGVHYDPMIAKVVVHAPDRSSALSGLRDALGSLQVAGVPTNAAFVQRVAMHPAFQAGAVDTSFISKHESELLGVHVEGGVGDEEGRVGTLVAVVFTAIDRQLTSITDNTTGPWEMRDAFHVNYTHEDASSFVHTESETEVQARVRGPGARIGSPSCYSVSMLSSAPSSSPSTHQVDSVEVGEDWIRAVVDGKMLRAEFCRHTYVCLFVYYFAINTNTRAVTYIYRHGDEELLDVWVNSGGKNVQHSQYRRPIIRSWLRTGAGSRTASSVNGAAAGLGTVRSPMPGRIVKVFVGQGDVIAEEGSPLCVVEAMKMEHAVKAPCAGVVQEMHAFEGAQVEDGQVLAIIGGSADKGGGSGDG